MSKRYVRIWFMALGLAVLYGCSSPSLREAPAESREGDSSAAGVEEVGGGASSVAADAAEDPACRFTCPHAGQVDAYAWHGQIVYLVRPGCCDQFDTVYTADCKRLCAPSGGFTGHGDGKCPGFYDEAAHHCAVQH